MTTPPTDILGQVVNCVYKEGENVKETLDKNTPVCANIRDKIHIDFRGATITDVINQQNERVITINAKKEVGYTVSNENTYKNMIITKYNTQLNLPNNVNKDNVTLEPPATGNILRITIRLPVSCGASSDTTCTYDTTLGKWITNRSFNHALSQGFKDVNQFNQNCAIQTGVDCSTSIACDLSGRTISTCNDAMRSVYEFTILKNPTSTGTNCEDVARSRLNVLEPNVSFTQSKVGNRITATRTADCTVNNTPATTCTESDDGKSLVKIMTRCIPPGNSFCVNKVCVSFIRLVSGPNYTPASPVTDANRGTGIVTYRVEFGQGTDVSDVNNFISDKNTRFHNFIKTNASIDYNQDEEGFDMTYDSNNRIATIKAPYSCGTFQKTPQNNDQCIYTGTQWIKRYNQSYTGETSLIKGTNALCNVQPIVDGSCNDIINCVLRRDTSVPDDCKFESSLNAYIQRIAFDISSNPNPPSLTNCLNIASSINPTYINYIQDGTKISASKSCTPNIDCSFTYLPCKSNQEGKNCGDGRQELQIIERRSGTGTPCPTATFIPCNLGLCPIDCIPEQWTDNWSECSKPCGGGTQTRTRGIASNALNGGACNAERTQSRECNTQPCPVNCVMGDWSSWSTCRSSDGKTCGPGKQTRTRIIRTPAINNGTCDEASKTTEEQPCNLGACPVTQTPQNCVMGSWTNWSSCVSSDGKTCGPGKQTRTRTVFQDETNGGVCPDRNITTQEQACDLGACPPTQTPQNCVMGSWSLWSSCSRSDGRTCGPGKQTRTRTVFQDETNGGVCPDRNITTQEQACDLGACPTQDTQDTTPVTNNVDCSLGDWGECSKTCGGGVRTRPILLDKQGSGRACPPTSEACNTQACPPTAPKKSNTLIIVIAILVILMLMGVSAFVLLK